MLQVSGAGGFRMVRAIRGMSGGMSAQVRGLLACALVVHGGAVQWRMQQLLVACVPHGM